MLQAPPVLEKSNSLDHLPLDNYRVPANTLTDEVKNHLLENSGLSGLIVTEQGQVVGCITRRAMFEKLSKDFSHALYLGKPISLMLENLHEEVLKVSSTTSIMDAVRLSFSRPAKSAYDPIVVVREGKEAGMLDFSKLILAQSEIFAIMNHRLTLQEQELRDYAQQVAEQGRSVEEYAKQLEVQQGELQERNNLLEAQKAQLQEQTEELSRKTEELFLRSEEIRSLNQRFEEVGILVSKEGEKTFVAMGHGVEAVIQFTQKINSISNDFRDKLTTIDQGNDLISKISKRVENLSFQASIIGSGLPVDDQNKLPFNMIIEEIEKLSVQIVEANQAINNISKELRSQIRVLVKTAEDNQEVVTNLAQNSQKMESALAGLSQLLN
jgi:CBS domain-containing protein